MRRTLQHPGSGDNAPRSVQRASGSAVTAALTAAIATLLSLASCASIDPVGDGEPQIPADAVENTRVEDNGDVITEYRVGGSLRMVRIQPSRGPVYYLVDDNGDGTIDRNTGGRGPMTYYKLFGF